MKNSKKGLVKVENGLRYKHDGDFWALDQDLVTVDRHHNYSGQQDPVKPLRVPGSRLGNVCRIFTAK